MSTRTERVFAAFQGPVLNVDVPVVHMYRAYTAELLLPLRWRRARSLAAADVLAALSGAHVRAQASLLSPPLRCDTCGGVVAVGNVWSGSRGLPDDLECYSATLRSRCTSSRKHLRAETVVLAIDLGGALVCSEPFAVFSRLPGRKAAKRDPESCSSAVVACSPAVAETPVPVAPSFALPPRLVVVVGVLRCDPALGDWPATRALIPGVAEELKRVPTFVMHKCSLIGGSGQLVVVVRAFLTVEDARRGDAIARDYARNKIPNVVNKDMSPWLQVLALRSNYP
eukprot:m51a1_g7156 hypothetical protein (283) ;mRNA; f:345494-346455